MSQQFKDNLCLINNMGIHRKITTDIYPFSVLDKVFEKNQFGEFYVKDIFDSFRSDSRKKEYLSGVSVVLQYCLENDEMEWDTVNAMSDAIANFVNGLE